MRGSCTCPESCSWKVSEDVTRREREVRGIREALAVIRRCSGRETVGEDSEITHVEVPSGAETPQDVLAETPYTPNMATNTAMATNTPNIPNIPNIAAPCQHEPQPGKARSSRRLVWSFTPKELAKLLGVKRNAVYRAISRGELDPSDLQSVCVAWYRRLRRRSGRVVEARPLTYRIGNTPKEHKIRRKEVPEPVGPVRVSQAAKVLGIAPQAIYKMIGKGAVDTYEVAPGPNTTRSKLGRRDGVLGVIVSDVRERLIDL